MAPSRGVRRDGSNARDSRGWFAEPEQLGGIDPLCLAALNTGIPFVRPLHATPTLTPRVWT
eukprot:349850-Chlamydomonas_euryale.AAC.4